MCLLFLLLREEVDDVAPFADAFIVVEDEEEEEDDDADADEEDPIATDVATVLRCRSACDSRALLAAARAAGHERPPIDDVSIPVAGST